MSNDDDIAVREVTKRIAQAERAIVKAWHALDGVQDIRKRVELEYRIINLGADCYPT